MAVPQAMEFPLGGFSFELCKRSLDCIIIGVVLLVVGIA